MRSLPMFPKVSGIFMTATILIFVGNVLLIISFASPYWMESYPESFSEFVRLGLWDVCFHNYRHPSYHFDERFDGCHWIFSHKYQNIREWLQPTWMMFVQAMISLAVIFSLLSLILMSILLMRFLIKLEMFILAIVFVMESLAALPIFLGVCVFGGMCFDRSWIQYPNFNHLSWAYGLAVISFVCHCSAGGVLIAEIYQARERKRRTNNFIYGVPLTVR